TASMAADAEVCAMLSDTLEAVGIPRGDYVVRVNNRKVLNGVMEIAGLGGEDKEAERGIVLRAIDKLDRLGLGGVRALLGAGRKDESGDFTQGAGLTDDQAAPILKFLELGLQVSAPGGPAGQAPTSPREGASTPSQVAGRPPSAAETVAALKALVESTAVGLSGVAELEEIAALLQAQGYGPDRIVIDPSVVRGLGYYTGPVYEAELTFEVQNEKGQTVQFGSVAGGGRYDDLVKRFTGQEVPATGVSIGVDRLLAALRAKRGTPQEAEGPVVVTVMDRARMADYQAMVAELRNAGLRAEVYLGNPKNFGNQMKYADRRGAPIAVIEGTDEHARGVVQLKDLIAGAEIAKDASLEEWKARPSQIEVARADLVAEVRKMRAAQRDV
ncbi:MAG: HisS family protein, partial [Pseudomonadota bacterium]